MNQCPACGSTGRKPVATLTEGGGWSECNHEWHKIGKVADEDARTNGVLQIKDDGSCYTITGTFNGSTGMSLQLPDAPD